MRSIRVHSMTKYAVAIVTGLALAVTTAGVADSTPSPSSADGAVGSGAEPVVAQSLCAQQVAADHATCFSQQLVNRKGAPVRPHAAQQASDRGLTPTQLRDAYDLPSLTRGAGRTIALVVAYNNPWAQSELTTYRQEFGLGACTEKKSCFRKVNQRGEQRDYPIFNAGWAAEAALDTQMVSAICPKCRIVLVEADSNSMEDLGAAEEKAARMGADVISNSWGTVDQDLSDAEWGHFYHHPGVPVVASSGDYGYMAGYPATSQHTIAVGGTTLTAAPDTARGWSEIGWYGAGSWCSDVNPKPVWQTDAECPGRMMSDVAAVADPATGVAVYTSVGGGWSVLGGTSAAAPIIASAYALADDTSALEYPVSRAYANPQAFNDITEGANWGDYDCNGNYFCNAAVGYDGLTGLGSPWGLGGL